MGRLAESAWLDHQNNIEGRRDHSGHAALLY
jgi:hypothetical protein